MQEYDEKKAVKAMRESLDPQIAPSYPDDEILNIIDIIWDWYDDNGLLDIDTEADDEEINVGQLISYVRKMIAKDKNSPIRPEDVEILVTAELAYEQSLDNQNDILTQ